ncbi:hypothetical protein IFM89_022150, partial [Coptis chinensis]
EPLWNNSEAKNTINLPENAIVSDLIEHVELKGSMNIEDVGYGGMARNEQGHVIFAFSGGGDVHSILFQELKAIQIGISLCIELGNRRIIVASDSLRAIQILKDIDTSPW